MCRAANSNAFTITVLATFAASIALSVISGCSPEIVISKTLGGCSETTMRSIDDALIKLTTEKEAKP